MNVQWTKTAEGHLDAIYAYISQDSSTYALSMVDKLTRKSEQIAMYPLSGRAVPEYERGDLREIIENPYRIIYRINERQIDIVAIIHTSRNMREIKLDQ